MEWWAELRAAGYYRPLVRILQEAVNSTEAMALEREWVKRLSANGEPLFNVGPETGDGHVRVKFDLEMWRALARIEDHVAGKGTNRTRDFKKRWAGALRFALLDCAGRLS